MLIVFVVYTVVQYYSTIVHAGNCCELECGGVVTVVDMVSHPSRQNFKIVVPGGNKPCSHGSCPDILAFVGVMMSTLERFTSMFASLVLPVQAVKQIV